MAKRNSKKIVLLWNEQKKNSFQNCNVQVRRSHERMCQLIIYKPTSLQAFFATIDQGSPTRAFAVRNRDIYVPFVKVTIC